MRFVLLLRSVEFVPRRFTISTTTRFFTSVFKKTEAKGLFVVRNTGGFEVHDFSVLDSVLQQANFRLHMASPFFRICIVEFARNAYMRPLLNFERAILEKCTVVHVKCSLDTCRKRNKRRRAPSSDHRSGYIPDKILDSFYAKEYMGGLTGLPLNGIVSLDTGRVPLRKLQDAVKQKLLPLVVGINRS
jgi:hypothetical protein